MSRLMFTPLTTVPKQIKLEQGPWALYSPKKIFFLRFKLSTTNRHHFMGYSNIHDRIEQAHPKTLKSYKTLPGQQKYAEESPLEVLGHFYRSEPRTRHQLL